MDTEPSAAFAYIRNLGNRLKSWCLRRGKERRVCVCRVCGTRAVPVMVREASTLLALILLVLLIIPGLLYLLWQYFHPIAVCPLCGSSRLYPARPSAGGDSADEAP